MPNNGHNPQIELLRVSVTDRCNQRCIYCMPEHGVPLFDYDELLRLEEIADVVRLLAERFGMRRVRLTGGEPLLRRNVVGLVEMLAKLGLDEVLLTTNGQLLAEHAAALKAAGLTRVNVSLDTLAPDRYRRITRGAELQPVLDGIDAAIHAGLHPIKLNTIVMRGENDDEMADLVRFALSKRVEIRFLELIAIGAAIPFHERCFVPLGELLAKLRSDFDVQSLPRMNSGPSTSHVLTEHSTGRQVRIGTIASETRPFCSLCRRLRLTSRGELRACLMSPAGRDLRPWLRSPDRDLAEFDGIVRRVFALKPALRCHQAHELMSKIGG